MASEGGYSSTDIIEHYYTGTSVVPLSQAAPSWMVNDPSPLWVNLTSTPYSTAQTVSFATTGGSLTFCQQEPAWVGSMYEAKNKGVYSAYVELLEQRLADLGFAPGTVDGLFDGSTTTAVKAFQSSQGLGVDGIVGPNTKNALWSSDSSDRCVIETPLNGTPKKLTPSADGSECVLQGASLPGDCFGSVRGLSTGTRLVIPERKVRNDSSIELAHGVLRVRPDRSGGTGGLEGIHVLVELSLDDYVKGIDEVPFSWHTEALEAQAIASRSYAAGTAKGRGPESGFSGSLKDTCWCHVWSNAYSQVYAGYYPESTYSRWKTAANDTASLVVKHPSAGLATTYFSSSSGGATEANEDAWGSAPVPYLRSVPDPWSLTTANPFANWQYAFSPATVAARVGLDELTGAAVVETNQSGSARTVRFVGLSGGIEVSVEKSGGWVRSVFGLRSNHYDVVWGDVSSAPPAPATEETATPKFSDVEGNTFEKDIEWALETGVTRGCNPPDNTRFCPNDRVSRGQMAAFLTRFLDLPAATEDFFDDDNGSTFEDDINRLASAGITRGCGNGRFCPASSVTREQMAAFLVRAFQLTDNTHGGFEDVSQSNTFAEDIGRLATAGITVGCNPPSNTKYCPGQSVTRAQMTAFLHRASAG